MWAWSGHVSWESFSPWLFVLCRRAYFSMVITLLALQPMSAVMLVLVYGVGTALPVVGLAALIGLGVQWASQAFRLLATAEKILRTVTGLILLLIGLYFVARFNFDLPIGIGF